MLVNLTTNKLLLPIALVSLGFASATNGEPIIFSAMGCGPYTPPDKPAVAFYVQQENRERISEFMVHLGDVFRTPTVKNTNAAPANSTKEGATVEPPLPCDIPTEAEYHWTADLLSYSNTIPTWIVVGDNEWNDLVDPVQGWKWWQKYYARFEERFHPAWQTERQPERQENFTFVRKGVVFVGINLPGGRVH